MVGMKSAIEFPAATRAGTAEFRAQCPADNTTVGAINTPEQNPTTFLPFTISMTTASKYSPGSARKPFFTSVPGREVEVQARTGCEGVQRKGS